MPGTSWRASSPPASHVFLVAEGEVQFRNRIEEGNEDIDVGQSRTAWTPVGWSGFLEPRRYSTTVVCKTDCRALRLGHQALATLFADDPALGAGFLDLILRRCLEVLAERRSRIVHHSRTPANFGQSLDTKGEEEAYNRAPPPVMELFRRSAFFEVFEESQLRLFAEAVREPLLLPGRGRSSSRGAATRGCGCWPRAAVALNYRPAGMRDAFALRTLSNPGSVAALAGIACIESSQTSVQAMRDCTLYRIDPERMQAALDRDPRLALALVRRPAVAGGRPPARRPRSLHLPPLRAGAPGDSQPARAELHAAQRQLPHPSTAAPARQPPDARRRVRAARSDGGQPRRARALAGAALPGPARGRSSASTSSSRPCGRSTTPWSRRRRRCRRADVRKLCARGFREAFGRTRYVIEGEHHLPATAGHIFIFNHLKNHEYNTLPNNFQLTLDSHFVSAMILDPRYGDSGIRVVRPQPRHRVRASGVLRPAGPHRRLHARVRPDRGDGGAAREAAAASSSRPRAGICGTART